MENLKGAAVPDHRIGQVKRPAGKNEDISSAQHREEVDISPGHGLPAEKTRTDFDPSK